MRDRTPSTPLNQSDNSCPLTNRNVAEAFLKGESHSHNVTTAATMRYRVKLPNADDQLTENKKRADTTVTRGLESEMGELSNKFSTKSNNLVRTPLGV